MGKLPEISLRETDLALSEGREIALIDVRQRSLFAQGHLPRSASMPLERLEIEAARLIPSRDAPICLIGDGPDSGLSKRACKSLSSIGYRSAVILKGGASSIASCGRRLWRGTGALSWALARWAAKAYGIPAISSASLLERHSSALIVDTRGRLDFEGGSIAESLSAPGLEAVSRLFAQDIDPRRLVVIVGRPALSALVAQSLICAGLPNPVFALSEGIEGWRENGLSLVKGSKRLLPSPSPGGLLALEAPSRRLIDLFSLRAVDWKGLSPLSEDSSKSLRLIDLRSEEEYLAGHPPGFSSVPSCYLLSNLEGSLPVCGCAVVLYDDVKLRALSAAAWLRQAGWERTYCLIDPKAPKEEGEERDFTERTFLTYLRPRISVARDSGNLAIVDVTPGQGRPRPPAVLRAQRSGLPKALADFEAKNPEAMVALASEDLLDALLCASELLRQDRVYPVLGEALAPWPEPEKEEPLPAADDLAGLLGPSAGRLPPDSRPISQDEPEYEQFKKFS